jgi:CheY-like chemotaxis protein
VFETYRQAEQGLAHSRGGLGLGLGLVKGLVALHGGAVQAASAGRGRGADFTLWLPLGQAPAVPGPLPEAGGPAGKPRRVLVIDDNRDAADSLHKLLRAAGHELAVAYTGPDGVETARHFRPDVVFCDLQLPGVDGYGVARALRQDAATAGARLIALSGYGSPADQERCVEAGFELLLTKPVEPEGLLRLLTAEDPGATP